MTHGSVAKVIAGLSPSYEQLIPHLKHYIGRKQNRGNLQHILAGIFS